MGRPRIHVNDAAKQRAYRERHAAPVRITQDVLRMRSHIRECYELGCSIEGMAEIMRTKRRAIRAMLGGLISPKT